MTIAFRVLENQHAIAQPQLELRRALGVGVVLRHPQPPARIPRERDGILHVRLGGEDCGLEARRQLHLRGDLYGGHRRGVRVRLGVEGPGKIGGAGGERGEEKRTGAGGTQQLHRRQV